MNNKATPIELLFEKAEDYSKTTIELFKLNAIDKSADGISSFISRLAVFIAVALSVLIINIGFALWIGQLLGNSFCGFFIVGAFYAIAAIILHKFKNVWIKK